MPEKKLAFGSEAAAADRREKATFGAGCFWGVQYGFDKQKGVVSSEVGYMGGDKENPTTNDIYYMNTGHVEVVQLEFDPKEVSYEELLDIFWKIHDPTQVNRQGPDRGEEYRSVIFTHSKEQAEMAEASKEAMELSGKYDDSIVTSIEPVSKFWRAEEFHQKFDEKRGYSTCRL